MNGVMKSFLLGKRIEKADRKPTPEEESQRKVAAAREAHNTAQRAGGDVEGTKRRWQEAQDAHLQTHSKPDKEPPPAQANKPKPIAAVAGEDARGKPCKQGQSAELTGCIPAKDENLGGGQGQPEIKPEEAKPTPKPTTEASSAATPLDPKPVDTSIAAGNKLVEARQAYEEAQRTGQNVAGAKYQWQLAQAEYHRASKPESKLENKPNEVGEKKTEKTLPKPPKFVTDDPKVDVDIDNDAVGRLFAAAKSGDLDAVRAVNTDEAYSKLLKRTSHNHPKVAEYKEKLLNALDAPEIKVGKAIDSWKNRLVKGMDEDAKAVVNEFMDELKQSIYEIGPERALAAFGESKGEGKDRIQYEGSYDILSDESDTFSNFLRKYLDNAGVTLISSGSSVDPNVPYVSSWSEAQLESEKRPNRPKKPGDYTPTDPTLKNKLEETKLLPGLESTEDIDVVAGHKVTQFTPEVIAKFDAKYGKGKWLVKSYSTDAYAGYGVFFPEYVTAQQENAKSGIADARRELHENGYGILRDKQGNISGIGDLKTKKTYVFGSKEFREDLPENMRKLGHTLAIYGANEKGLKLPASPIDDLKHGAYHLTLLYNKTGKVVGLKDIDGENYIKGTEGYRELVGEEGSSCEHAVERAEETAEALAEGYKPDPKFMVSPAFEALASTGDGGVSSEDRAQGNTWETSKEGRVHAIIRNGKIEIVPYATMRGRKDYIPAVIPTEETKAMEKAVQDALEQVCKKKPSECTGRLYAPDVLKTKDGWKVVELNGTTVGGGSDWLGRNPFVIDALASHVSGRDPQHVKFIRRLLKDRKSNKHKKSWKFNSMRPMKSMLATKAAKESYFAGCKRDDKGHCLPKGGSGPQATKPSSQETGYDEDTGQVLDQAKYDEYNKKQREAAKNRTAASSGKDINETAREMTSKLSAWIDMRKNSGKNVKDLLESEDYKRFTANVTSALKTYLDKFIVRTVENRRAYQQAVNKPIPSHLKSFVFGRIKTFTRANTIVPAFPNRMVKSILKGDMEGKPCKPGYTHARDGCIVGQPGANQGANQGDQGKPAVSQQQEPEQEPTNKQPFAGKTGTVTVPGSGTVKWSDIRWSSSREADGKPGWEAIGRTDQGNVAYRDPVSSQWVNEQLGKGETKPEAITRNDPYGQKLKPIASKLPNTNLGDSPKETKPVAKLDPKPETKPAKPASVLKPAAQVSQEKPKEKLPEAPKITGKFSKYDNAAIEKMRALAEAGNLKALKKFNAKHDTTSSDENDYELEPEVQEYKNQLLQVLGESPEVEPERNQNQQESSGKERVQRVSGELDYSKPEVRANYAAFWAKEYKMRPAKMVIVPKLEKDKDTGELLLNKKGKPIPVFKNEINPKTGEKTGKQVRATMRQVVLADGTIAPGHIQLLAGSILPEATDVHVQLNPKKHPLIRGFKPSSKFNPVIVPFSKGSKKTSEAGQEKNFAKNSRALEKGHDVQMLETFKKHHNHKDAMVRSAADMAWMLSEMATRPGSEADNKGVSKYYNQPLTAKEIVVKKAKNKYGKLMKVKDKNGNKVQKMDVRIRLPDGKTFPLERGMDPDLAKVLLEKVKKKQPLGKMEFYLKSYGASTLEGRHVVVKGNKVSLQFVGKDTQWHDHLVEDKGLADMLKERKAKAGDKGKLFQTDEVDLRDYMKSTGIGAKTKDGDGIYTPKNLRTQWATRKAKELIAAHKKSPKTLKEYKARVKDIAEQVSNHLGNKPSQVLKSYIDPRSWAIWADHLGVDWKGKKI